MTDKKNVWLPLESNPDVMNKYVHSLGLSEKWKFFDIYGTEPDLLAMVPQPVHAVCLLFPITENSEHAKEEEEKKLTNNPTHTISPNLWYTKQTVGNACGTIAIIHSILNSPIQCSPDSFFIKFKKECESLNPYERATLLGQQKDLEIAHEGTANEGQSRVPGVDEQCNLHFVAFVCVDNTLYECDGRKFGPINHGPTSYETLLNDSVKVIKKFMERDPHNLLFNMVALSAEL